MQILDVTGKPVPACAVIECEGFNLSLSTICGNPAGPGDMRVYRAKPGEDGTAEDVTERVFPECAGGKSALACWTNVLAAIRTIQGGNLND